MSCLHLLVLRPFRCPASRVFLALHLRGEFPRSVLCVNPTVTDDFE